MGGEGIIDVNLKKWFGETTSGQEKTRPSSHPGWILVPDQVLAGTWRVKTMAGKPGGMGQVFIAEDMKLGITVAVKVPGLHVLQEAGSAERFLKEARVAAHLHGNPHIVGIRACLTDPHIKIAVGPESTIRLPFIVMDYLGGGCLADLLVRPLRLSDALASFRQICAGLQFAHSCEYQDGGKTIRGIIHRDIKPENICFDQDGRAVIVDFGIAGLLGQTAMTMCGTPGYMAPEQWNPAIGVDHRTDIYALGVLLFQMMTGRMPFEGSNERIMLGHVQNPPPNPRSIRAEVPEAVAEAILKALEKAKERRFASAKDFSEAVQEGFQGIRQNPVRERQERSNDKKPELPQPLAAGGGVKGAVVTEAREHIETRNYRAAFRCLHDWVLSGRRDDEALWLINQAYCPAQRKFMRNWTPVFWDGLCPECHTPLVFGEIAAPPQQAAGRAPEQRAQTPETRASKYAEDQYNLALEHAKAGRGAEAARCCLEAVNCQHPRAIELREHICCSRERRVVPAPDFNHDTWGFYRYWRGECPTCGAPLVLPRPVKGRQTILA